MGIGHGRVKTPHRLLAEVESSETESLIKEQSTLADTKALFHLKGRKNIERLLKVPQKELVTRQVKLGTLPQKEIRAVFSEFF